jgi:hypothetical protein
MAKEERRRISARGVGGMFLLLVAPSATMSWTKDSNTCPDSWGAGDVLILVLLVWCFNVVMGINKNIHFLRPTGSLITMYIELLCRI